jgi:hypothetical protein
VWTLKGFQYKVIDKMGTIVNGTCHHIWICVLHDRGSAPDWFGSILLVCSSKDPTMSVLVSVRATLTVLMNNSALKI